MTKQERKTFCHLCRNDYYNRAGNSTAGECWFLDSARVVRRTAVGTWQPPPYQWMPQPTLSCHNRDGFTWIARDDVRLVENGAKAMGQSDLAATCPTAGEGKAKEIQ